MVVALSVVLEFEIEVNNGTLEKLVFVFSVVFNNETELINDVKEVELLFLALNTFVELTVVLVSDIVWVVIIIVWLVLSSEGTVEPKEVEIIEEDGSVENKLVEWIVSFEI